MVRFNGAGLWTAVQDKCMQGPLYKPPTQGYVAAGFGGIWGATGMFIVKLDNNGDICANTISHNISVDKCSFGKSKPTVTRYHLRNET